MNDELHQRIRLLEAERLRPVPETGWRRTITVVVDDDAEHHLAALKADLAALPWGGAPKGSGAGEVRK